MIPGVLLHWAAAAALSSPGIWLSPVFGSRAVGRGVDLQVGGLHSESEEHFWQKGKISAAAAQCCNLDTTALIQPPHQFGFDCAALFFVFQIITSSTDCTDVDTLTSLWSLRAFLGILWEYNLKFSILSLSYPAYAMLFCQILQSKTEEQKMDPAGHFFLNSDLHLKHLFSRVNANVQIAGVLMNMFPGLGEARSY